MDEEERIEVLNAQRAELTYKLLIHRLFASKISNEVQIADDYENAVKAQIDEIDARLYLLGR